MDIILYQTPGKIWVFFLDRNFQITLENTYFESYTKKKKEKKERNKQTLKIKKQNKPKQKQKTASCNKTRNIPLISSLN